MKTYKYKLLLIIILSVTGINMLTNTVMSQSVEAGIAILLDAPRPVQNEVNVETSSKSETTNPQVLDKAVTSISTQYSTEQAPYPGCVQQLFQISGYYSPKPGQEVYNRDNYEAEIKLNGRGIHGASGAPVSNQMIAAPRSYAFGTVIVLPGLGIGQVQDRGGAIVNSQGYDRIDLWVGEGVEGLHRAKSIGMRRVLGWTCPENATDELGFERSAIPHYRDFMQVAFWSLSQDVGRSGPLVTMAQDYLRKLGYIDTDVIPGVYNQQMRDLVCSFQVKSLGLGGGEDYCGVLGPMTRRSLKSQLAKAGLVSDTSIYQLDNTSTITSLFTRPNTRPAREMPETITRVDTSPKLSITTKSVESLTTYDSSSDAKDTIPAPLAPVILNFDRIITTFDREVALGDRSDMVIVLQKVLAREKLFDHRVTGYFGPITVVALAQFQLKYKLIDSLQHPAAGHLGPATRALLAKKQRLLRLKPFDT